MQMLLGLRNVLCVLLFSLSTTCTASPSTIERDVCVIGGGSSGTYAAIRLQQMGKSVALVERENRLGGHVNTYVDPSTGQTYDYGVQVFSNISVVLDYFKHFDIPLATLTSTAGGVSKFVNFETGTTVSEAQLGGGNITAAFLEYIKLQDEFAYIYPNWDHLPNPVPEDLLMSFGDFLEKYNLQALAYTIFQYNEGAGNILAQPALYMLKYFDPLDTAALLGINPFVYNAHNDNQQLYDRALAELGSSALLSSHVKRVDRSDDGVEVCVSTPAGERKIKASKLIISIPPTVSNLAFLDLDSQEKALLGQFNNSYYWDALIKNSGIPQNTSVSNVNPQAPLDIPSLPGLYDFGATYLPNIHTTYYSSPHAMTNDEVKADILTTLARVRKALGYPEPAQEPEFVGFKNHAPFILTVSTEAIKGGFYSQLEALQGKSSTWWTGAAWLEQASSPLWNFTEYQILPNVVA